MGFEHESISGLGDRDWSERLLEALLDAGIAAAEREEIWETLRQVDDPRLVARLRAALRDATLAPEIREDVLQLILNSEENLCDAEVRELWDAGDPLFRHVVLRHLGDADVVVPIAADPDDPLVEDAIHALAFRFDDHIDLAVAALSHPRPDVRIAAVTTVMWLEPINAIPGLLACLDDADERVRTEAEDVLHYFSDRRVLRRLAESRGPSWGLMEAAFRDRLRREPALGDWMEPLRDVLGEDHAVDDRPYIAEPRPGLVPVDVEAVMSEVRGPHAANAFGPVSIGPAWPPMTGLGSPKHSGTILIRSYEVVPQTRSRSGTTRRASSNWRATETTAWPSGRAGDCGKSHPPRRPRASYAAFSNSPAGARGGARHSRRTCIRAASRSVLVRR